MSKFLGALLAALFALLSVTPAAAQQTVAYRIAGGTITSLNGAISILNLAGQSACTTTLAGTFVGTASFRVTNDGTHWVPVTSYPDPGSGTGGTQITTTSGTWISPVANYTGFQIIFLSYTSGTATGTVTCGPGVPGAIGGASGGGGGGSGAPLSGGSQGVVLGNNQSVAIHGFNGTSLDAVRVGNPSGDATQAVESLMSQGFTYAFNGTSWDRLRVSAAGTPVAGGTPGVLAVQGTGASGALPIIGTVTANAGTGNFTVTQSSGSNLHVTCDLGCGSAPGWNYTNTTGTTAVVIKASSGVLAGVTNLSTLSQTAGMTCTWYDNATSPSGTVLYTLTQIGPGQVISFGSGNGLRTTNGLTMQCTGGTPNGSGIMTLWQ